MRKLLAAGAILALLLTACSRGNGALPTGPSMSESIGSAEAMTCSDAFTALSAITVQSITTLDNAGDKLDATIQHCPSVSEWRAGLQAVLPSLDASKAEEFIARRCQGNPELTTALLCRQVGS